MTVMTPIDYVWKYRSIPLLNSDGHREGSVEFKKYLIYKGQDLPEKERFRRGVRKHLRKHEEIAFRVETVQGLRVDTFVSRKDDILHHGIDAFFGKGSPEDIQYTIQTARAIGLTTLGRAETWANNHLGVDCSGFVGNYLWHVYNSQCWYKIGDARKSAKNEVGPSSGIPKMCKKPYVEDMTEIIRNPHSTYVLARCDRSGRVYPRAKPGSPAHVMITEPNSWAFDRNHEGVTPLGVAVCESVRGGPDASWYPFVGVKKGVFTFRRSNKNLSKIMVRMHRLK